MLRFLARWLRVAIGSALLGFALIGAGLYWYFLRSGPPPQAWHTLRLADFKAADAATIDTLAEYRALEERLFDELDRRVYLPPDATGAEVLNRYRRGSRSDPGAWPVNWNRSFHLPAGGDAPRGRVLLLHGLTDSPYSLRSIGAHLARQGHEVVGLRLPGHGTAPSGLISFRLEDMRAAVRMAVVDMQRQAPHGQPLYLVGYSNGAALAVDYALATLDDAALPRPAGLVLISPAIAVSRLAAVGRLQTGLSSVPGFERAAWETITLEIDPFKYSSFSLHAAGETHRLTRGLARDLERHFGGTKLSGFPPVLVFLSAVDSTVQAEPVVSTLLDRLPHGGHELVLFDVNRYTPVQQLLVADPGPLTRELQARVARPFALTIVGNEHDRTLQVVERRTPSGSTTSEQRSLGTAWPPAVFSLSHVALPFPPDDPLYGYLDGLDAPTTPHLRLGDVAVRGENGVLRVPLWMLTRQRSNPFHAYLLERIDGFLGHTVAP